MFSNIVVLYRYKQEIMSLTVGNSSSSESEETGSMGTEPVINMFNKLLSDYKVFEQSMQGLHWLSKGEMFHRMHAVFGELYDAAGVDIDELAERVVMMGGKPPHCAECFSKLATLEAIVDVEEYKEAIKKTLVGLEHLKKAETDILEMVEKHLSSGERRFNYGTIDLLSKILYEQEKTCWMLTKTLGEDIK